ncbi:hypothetical protein CYMTET_35816 [Cymbomonas tetramitiformis]|uniref:Uncharacterized protein n=1 Tax=Cymbomonas tetramitiformis TaxID=36881 RepID=A0AAE0KNS1_9CHLO|nr:hypothetical protein CYMTET_35816 [Cymbomonas tetramitiformis]
MQQAVPLGVPGSVGGENVPVRTFFCVVEQAELGSKGEAGPDGLFKRRVVGQAGSNVPAESMHNLELLANRGALGGRWRLVPRRGANYTMDRRAVVLYARGGEETLNLVVVSYRLLRSL